MFVQQINRPNLLASIFIFCTAFLVTGPGAQADEEMRLVGVMSAKKRGDVLRISLKVEEGEETCVYTIPLDCMDRDFALRMNNREVEVVGLVTTRRAEKTITVKQCYGVYIGKIEVVRGEKGGPSILRLKPVRLNPRDRSEKKTKITYHVTLDETGLRLSKLPASGIVRVVGALTRKEDADWITVQSFQPLVRYTGTITVDEDDNGRMMQVTFTLLDDDDEVEIHVVLDGKGMKFGRTMEFKEVEILGIPVNRGKEKWIRLIDFRKVEEEEDEDDKE